MTDARAALLAAVQDIATDLPTPLEISGDFVICGDAHNPYCDYQLLERLCKVARREKITALIHVGDWWNFDNFSFYPPLMVPPSWKTEKRTAKAVAKRLAYTFKDIYMTMGNHDRRRTKATQGEEDDEDVFSPIASVVRNLRTTIYGWLDVISGGVRWRLTHPKNYSVNQLVVADQLAQKFDCNIISFHEHHLAIGYDRYKRHVIVNGGMLATGRFPYVHLDDSKAAGMAKGFVVLKRGIATIYGDGLTDWGKYEKD